MVTITNTSKSKTLVLALVLSLNSCAIWDFIKPTGKGISVDTEIVAGDKAINTEVSGKKETTNNTADAITQTYNSVNKQAPWWIIVLLILGWILPQPSKMWSNLTSLLPWKGKGRST